jgi:mono/diheme cytochrome c family protein
LHRSSLASQVRAVSYRRSRQAVVGSLLGVLIAAGSGDLSHASNPEQGKRLALTHCARCHSIDKVSPSPLKIAPPFRTLHERYPVDTLQEALAEGIVTGHPKMPEFRFDGDQVGDFIAYLKTLE